MSNTIVQHPASYRDPSGFVFENNGVIYRQVNLSFQEDFDEFINSGCYDRLVNKRLLIAHEEVAENLNGSPGYYKTIRPRPIQFISYPYEWSFDMLRDAAMLTLQSAREVLEFNMILKDATPYNVQWHEGKLVFIDSLSFVKYKEEPWIAYRQFCESFLGPLLIMHYSKQQLPELLLAWPDGIPLAVIQSMLPVKSRFSLHSYLHIHLHAKFSQKKNTGNDKANHLSKKKLLDLITSLEVLISKLKTPVQKTAWSEYYDEASQRDNYLDQKKNIVSGWLDKIYPIHRVIDLGANDGEFSKIAAKKNILTIAADLDPYCINNLYSEIKKTEEKYIQPLVIDLSHPTPGMGVNNKERSSFLDRANSDVVLVLALIHHLAIGKNIPFDTIAGMLSRRCRHLVIEFVPKEDEKVKQMLQTKKDIYLNYSQENFETAFTKYFSIVETQSITGTARTLYLMQLL
jgi:2-polyprenyl-3-methyl-5-hydroxy-6-metoxy-1,4-benzoquinol methylase